MNPPATLTHLIAELRRLDQEASAGPCQFCGNKDCEVQSEVDISGSWANVYCGNCHCCGPTISAPKLTHIHEIKGLTERIEAEAIAAWNTRANLAPNLVDMLETAERALKGVLPTWHDEDDHKLHNGSVAGEITWGDVRAVKAALAELERLATTVQPSI